MANCASQHEHLSSKSITLPTNGPAQHERDQSTSAYACDTKARKGVSCLAFSCSRPFGAYNGSHAHPLMFLLLYGSSVSVCLRSLLPFLSSSQVFQSPSFITLVTCRFTSTLASLSPSLARIVNTLFSLVSQGETFLLLRDL